MSVKFSTIREFEDSCRDFIDYLRSDLVMLRIQEMNTEKYKGVLVGKFSFQVFFNLKDKYIESKNYDEGSAYIYLSKKFYDDADKYGEQIFGKKPGWNNTFTIGWF